MMHRQPTSRNDEGAALVLSLLLAMALSAIAVSLVFLSESETMGSLNYRLMSQARYGAESGIHKSINYLLNNYAKPGTAADPLAAYDLTASPVRYNGQPVVLSAVGTVVPNYPVAAVRAAFAAASQGTLPVGGYNVQYNVYATLMSMRSFPVYGAGGTETILTWRITAVGTIAGNRPATVEVNALLEQQIVPSQTYGLFATSATCGAITFTGNAVSNSYDSTNMTMSGGAPVTQNSGGDVGTNGNLSIGGHVSVNGSLSTPRSGVGNCNNGNVNALSETGQADVTGGVIQLPQTVQYPTPALPNPLPPTTSNAINNTCAGAGIASNCSGPSGNLTLTPGGAGVHMTLGNVTMTGGCTLHLTAGIYDINSISLAGNSNLIVDSGPVIINVVGTGQATPIDFTGGGIQNPTFKPGQLQFLYAGTGAVKVAGGTQSSAMIFAPNADVSIVGGSNFYGAVLGKTITDTGGTNYHYDRSLQDDFFMAGNYMLSAFTWKKY